MKQPFLVLLSILVLFAGCQRQKTILDSTQTINSDKWYADSVATFKITISDTTQPYDIYIKTSNSNLYNFQNIYMFVSIQFPHNVERVDTIDCYMANDKGKWFGKKNDDYYDQKLLYRRKIIFPFPGDYQFVITQAMRQEPLEGIHAIGLVIEESKD